MPFEQLLVHTCAVYRRPGTTDRFGQPTEATATGTPLHTYPCRFTNEGGGKRNNDRMEEVFENIFRLFLPAGSDVREDDLLVITDVQNRQVFESSRIQNDTVSFDSSPYAHHLELKVWVQRGPYDAADES